MVGEIAERVDPELAAWIKTEVRFPVTMIDRIVPGVAMGAETYVCWPKASARDAESSPRSHAHHDESTDMPSAPGATQ